ncbi:MAG: hypothetical protein E7289_06670 [Lachnospiraceae bacterium]|nr:hypothetical protein [Lachnospiraceae bacterium]
MKNKKVQAMLATTVMTAALIGGCAFNPAEEEMSEVYGPAPFVEEEQAVESELEETTEEEQISEDDFVAESEAEVCVYGPAPVE